MVKKIEKRLDNLREALNEMALDIGLRDKKGMKRLIKTSRKMDDLILQYMKQSSAYKKISTPDF